MIISSQIPHSMDFRRLPLLKLKSILFGPLAQRLGREVDVEGGADIQICNESTPKASFLPVKASSFDHDNVLSTAIERLN